MTVALNSYTTITLTATPTSESKTSSSGLSSKNKKIVIGCVVGIGVPLLIVALILTYMFCVKPRRTNFLNSDGKIVTAYTAGKFSRWWKTMMGKELDEYETSSPENDIDGPNDVPQSANAAGEHSNHRKSHSNELMLEEEKYYDDDGNELNGRNY